MHVFPSVSMPVKDPVVVFFILLLTILIIPIIFRKIHLPSIIGLILAGVFIGPFGFNILSRDSLIEILGTAGLLYIMFLAGLDLDLIMFKKSVKKALVFGLLTFGFPLFVGIYVCLYLFKFDLTASLLVASMFSTQTLISYPIVSRYNITKNEAVVIAVGGTIVTDTLVLVLFSIITGTVANTEELFFWLRITIGSILYLSIAFFIVPKISRWFFKYSENEKTMQFVFVLFMVYLNAVMAKLCGIEPIIGAFIAGIVFSRQISKSSMLANRIEFFGHALFIPVFLIGVGMLIDIGILFRSNLTLFYASVLTLVALFTKFVPAWLTRKIFKLTPLQGRLIFGLSSSHAAATLAIIIIAYQMHLINDLVLNSTIILILVTCLVSSFITERTARQIIMDNITDKDNHRHRHDRILIPISNPANVSRLIEAAILLREKESPELIYPLSVVTDGNDTIEKIESNQQAIEKVLETAKATGIPYLVVTRVDLNPVNGIIRASKELLISDIVIGFNEKRSPSQYIFGSLIENLLTHTKQNIWVCRFPMQLGSCNDLLMVFPPNCQYEAGMAGLMSKLGRFATGIQKKITILWPKNAEHNFLKRMNKNFKTFHSIPYNSCYELVEYQFKISQMVLVVHSRKGALSYDATYNSFVSNLSAKIENQNFMVVYPYQKSGEFYTNVIESDKFDSVALNENVNKIQEIGKNLKKIIKKSGFNS